MSNIDGYTQCPHCRDRANRILDDTNEIREILAADQLLESSATSRFWELDVSHDADGSPAFAYGWQCDYCGDSGESSPTPTPGPVSSATGRQTTDDDDTRRQV